jgi:KaiC/GvpD/RAD55 family RecA-like ATPase
MVALCLFRILVSTGIGSLDQILGDGYPEKSCILILGQSGLGKQALAYWFTRSGLIQGDYCLYVTHRPVADIVRDNSAQDGGKFVPLEMIQYLIQSPS